MIIFLIGPRGCGKSTIGKLLAKRLSLRFCDTDTLIVQTAGASVTDIVAAEGWEGFRRREARALLQAAVPDTVVATGGGMVLAEENRAVMRDNGTVVYLAATANVLRARLSRSPDKSGRPSLTGAEPLQEIELILAEREPLYRQTAHIVVPAALPPKEVVKKIRNGLAHNSDSVYIGL